MRIWQPGKSTDRWGQGLLNPCSQRSVAEPSGWLRHGAGRAQRAGTARLLASVFPEARSSPQKSLCCVSTAGNLEMCRESEAPWETTVLRPGATARVRCQKRWDSLCCPCHSPGVLRSHKHPHSPGQHPETTPACTSPWLLLEALPGDVPGTQEPSRGRPCRACAFTAKQVKKVLSPRSGLAPAAPGRPDSAGTLPGTKDGVQGPHPERSVPGQCHGAAPCPQGGRTSAGEPACLLRRTGARGSPFPWLPNPSCPRLKPAQAGQHPAHGTSGRVTAVGSAQRRRFRGRFAPNACWLPRPRPSRMSCTMAQLQQQKVDVDLAAALGIHRLPAGHVRCE